VVNGVFCNWSVSNARGLQSTKYSKPCAMAKGARPTLSPCELVPSLVNSLCYRVYTPRLAAWVLQGKTQVGL
jgi:hypothetical protein